MSDNNLVTDYGWSSTDAPPSCNYIEPAIIDFVKRENPGRVLDLGCGNGRLCQSIKQATNTHIVGIDNDPNGITLAKEAFPGIPFYNYGVQDNPETLIENEGELFDVVISTEVIEHLFSPQLLPKYAYSVLKPGGKLFITTPYHGYLKNLVLSILNKWDSHHTVLWEGGHIKFWSVKTISTLLQDNGFKVIEHTGVGRIPYLWKSMVIVCHKPMPSSE